MARLLSFMLCRLFGRRCSSQRPATRDLIAEMQQTTRRVDAQTIDLRRRREDIAGTLRGRHLP